MDRDQIHALASILGSAVDDRRNDVVIQCPMAPVTHAGGTDTHPAFSVKIDTSGQSVCLCFACGVSGSLLQVITDAHEVLDIYGDALRFVEEHDKGGFAAALARLRMGREGPHAREGEPRVFNIVRYVARCMGRVPQYLIDRGIVRSDIEKWRIGFDSETQRAVFPVWDETGVLVGASRRTVMPKDIEWRCLRCNRLSVARYLCCDADMAYYPKYHDTPGLPKDSVFYGEHNIDTTRDRVFIVEGILDAVFASRVLPNVICLMGANTGIGTTRMRKLRNWCNSVTLILDSDTAGDRAWAGWDDQKGRHHPGLRERLRTYFPVKVAHLPVGEDPASVAPATLIAAVDQASYLGA